MERKNINISDMVNNMLKTKKKSKSFWVEAINYDVYLSNKYSTKGLNKMTTKEAWSEEKSYVTYLKVF